MIKHHQLGHANLFFWPLRGRSLWTSPFWTKSFQDGLCSLVCHKNNRLVTHQRFPCIRYISEIGFDNLYPGHSCRLLMQASISSPTGFLRLHPLLLKKTLKVNFVPLPTSWVLHAIPITGAAGSKISIGNAKGGLLHRVSSIHTKQLFFHPPCWSRLSCYAPRIRVIISSPAEVKVSVI